MSLLLVEVYGDLGVVTPFAPGKKDHCRVAN